MMSCSLNFASKKHLVAALLLYNAIVKADEIVLQEVDLYLRQQWQDGRLQYDVDPREEIEQVCLFVVSLNPLQKHQPQQISDSVFHTTFTRIFLP